MDRDRARGTPGSGSNDLRHDDDRYSHHHAYAGPSRSRYESRYDYGSSRDDLSPPPSWGQSAPPGRPSSSSRHHSSHSSGYPSHQHYSYSYPYPPPPPSAHHPRANDAPATSSAPPPHPSAWGPQHWAPPPHPGYSSSYSGPTGPSYPSTSSAPHNSNMRHPHHRGSLPPPSRPPPSPPPPASPSQIRAPPPPASAPSPPRSGASSPPAGYLPGFQPDYARARAGATRRPSATSAAAESASAVAAPAGNATSADVRPPPTEAYLLLRPHRVPRGGWPPSTDPQQAVDSTGWSYNLVVLQHPERGKALGVEQLRRGWPPLTPPLIVQLIVKDQDGQEIPTDNPALARRLVHLTMSVELVSPDGSESRAMMRVRPPSPRGNVQPYYPASAPPPYSVQRTLLGSSVRTAQVLTRENRKGLYFIFQDMVVRPEGKYALDGKVLDLAGPPHIGTSIGVTHPLAFCRTQPFDVIIPQDFPSPVPITPLSAEFLRQGERHLGRRPRNDEGEGESEGEDGGGNE
ncbi:hypothetical protein A1Q2_02846 [Trichosporon asahii var. asahii CBS 8904]|uniref:Velvet domain-containing protein n=1 Tax=Trichosporon asahii var. asahii (strain CBS 8904) TaxID=1220162 RepID=K1VTI6_TRIAC|nr:hypothetical protein A1Q2_02846 [Trichosporon asahii var. asahii CBS 8904]